MRIDRLILFASLTMALSACGGGGGGGTTDNPVVNPGGVGSVVANGGNGINGIGGNAGSFLVESFGTVKLADTGTVDTTMPAVPAINLGTGSALFTPYTVSGADEKIIDNNVDNPVPATYVGLYVKTIGDNNLYLADGDNNLTNDKIVIGLLIPAGKSLTVEGINYNPANNQGVLAVMVNDIVVEGTLKTGLGRNAIDFRTTGGNVIIKGTITTSGENNGMVKLVAQKNIFNIGTINASGSDGSTDGNSSLGVFLNANTGSCYSSGTIKANGGKGTFGFGGAGGSIELIGTGGAVINTVITGGNVILSGILEAKGGSSTSGGGSGGGLNVSAYGGNLLANASFDGTGGDSTTGVSFGGTGADVVFSCFGDFELTGECKVTGIYTISGGKGPNGGNGGFFSMLTNVKTAIDAPNAQLLGIGKMTMNGGSATVGNGGIGGDVDVFTYAGRAIENSLVSIIQISGGSPGTPGSRGANGGIYHNGSQISP